MAHRVFVGTGGWTRWELDGPDVEVMTRFDEGPNGRFVVVELAAAALPGVTGEAMRAIPVPRFEAWANGLGREAVRAALDARRAMDQAELDDLDARQRGEANLRAHHEMTVEELDEYPEAPAPSPVRLGSLRLRVPEKKPRPDAFYERVRDTYERAAFFSKKPAKLIADANGVPVTRVHNWVQEARRRGLWDSERQRKSR